MNDGKDGRQCFAFVSDEYLIRCDAMLPIDTYYFLRPAFEILELPNIISALGHDFYNAILSMGFSILSSYCYCRFKIFVVSKLKYEGSC